MSQGNEIRMGSEVQDVTTGLTGIVTSRADQFNGNVQWGVQPRCPATDQTRLPETWSFDAATLTWVGPGLEDKARESATPRVQLGDHVKDIASGVKGVAVTRWTYINGCVALEVVLPHDGKSTLEEMFARSVTISESRLRRIDKPSLAPVTDDTPAKAKGGKKLSKELLSKLSTKDKDVRPTGGPATRVPRS